MDMNAEVVAEVRNIAKEMMGGTCTFVDDDVRLMAALAQRAVLAGLTDDCQTSMKRNLSVAAEKDRREHERAVGYSIGPSKEVQSGRHARRDLAALERQLAEIGIVVTDSGWLWLSAAGLTGEAVELDALDEDWFNVLLPGVGSSPRRSWGCVRMVEPE